MAYSEKLNGYWEEGYHYYMEFRDDRLTMREYRRKVILETTVSYDGAALDRGEETEIIPADPVFDRWPDGRTAMEIRSLRWVAGELRMLEYYTIMGEKEYTLKKAEGGPFRHIRIRDDEVLPGLQGLWREWRPNGGSGSALTIEGSTLSWEALGGGRIHAISRDYAPERILLVPEDLTESDFGGFSEVEVRGNMLLTRRIVMDMSVPTSVFAREEDLASIEVPESARTAPRSTMGPAAIFQTTASPTSAGPMGAFMGMGAAFGGINQMNQAVTEKKPRYCAGCGHPIYAAEANFCPDCGHKLAERKGAYCPECGYKLEEGLRFCPECGTKL